MRIAVLEKEKCKAGVDCPYICMSVCPVNRTKKECIAKFESKVKIDEGLCIGCNICVKKCPFNAISIINLPEALDETPLHQYGWNGFRIFGLPTPKFGKVIGVLGKNGLGKSTALKILSGIIIPNFDSGNDSKEEVVKHFKGSEAMTYFKNLYDDKIKVVYKVQDVTAIAKAYKGKTVKELLKSVDEKDMFDYVIEELDLKNILDNDVSKISGGELQRLAIAATFMRKANVYFIDEPSSFLDIKQRLKVGRFIQGLVSDDIAVMVIEHDLIMLDYISDLIYILYGEPAKYGITSMLKSTKQGINEFIDGFLSDENMRIRDKSLNFGKSTFTKKPVTEKLLHYTNLKKRFEKFELSTDHGTIHKKHIVGIIGENGIGKTTFVKMIADVLKPDDGSVELLHDKKDISYKPQYLEIADDVPVLQYLEGALKYPEIIRNFELDKHFQKRLSQLSGGELQKVFITKALAHDASIYLLDEPSAYLDVEQRLLIAKTIRDFIDLYGKTVMVVDHDLLFIDYLTDDMIVFDGVPGLSGYANQPVEMSKGMNSFLKRLNITMRRDHDSNRPRINKIDSVKDKEQKAKDNYYE